RLLDVTHLRRRSATAPLLAHEAELHPGGLQQLRDGSRIGRAIEGGLAVDEQQRLAAYREVEPRGPGRHVLLLDRYGAEDGLTVRVDEALDPALPSRLLVARIDHERSHRLDHVDRSRAVAIEVAGEQRVRAAQLARAALGAVNEVVGD